MPARIFVKGVLCDTIGMKILIEGPDYSFGKNREGNISLLKDMARVYGFEVIISEWFVMGTQRVSSTEIRSLVRLGMVEQAAELLGRSYQVRGNVVYGRHRGENLLGVCAGTVKVHDQVCPEEGIYEVEVEHNGLVHRGVVSVGSSPAPHNGDFAIEVHIPGFAEEICDGFVRVNFIRRLHGEKELLKPEVIVAQTRLDVTVARKILTDHG